MEVVVVAFGGVIGDLAGAGGGVGTSAGGLLLLALLTDRDRVCPTFLKESLRKGGTLSLLS